MKYQKITRIFLEKSTENIGPSTDLDHF